MQNRAVGKCGVQFPRCTLTTEYCIVCVILSMANRVAPAFRFCLDNSTLTQAIPIRYPFFCLSHIIVTPTGDALLPHTALLTKQGD